MLEVFFYCTCGHTGTVHVPRREWTAKTVKSTCPQCHSTLRQQKMNFELLDRALQRERVQLVYKKGVLSRIERMRLHEIHNALGHPAPETLTDTQVDVVLDRTGALMNMIRSEMH